MTRGMASNQPYLPVYFVIERAAQGSNNWKTVVVEGLNQLRRELRSDSIVKGFIRIGAILFDGEWGAHFKLKTLDEDAGRDIGYDCHCDFKLDKPVGLGRVLGLLTKTLKDEMDDGSSTSGITIRWHPESTEPAPSIWKPLIFVILSGEPKSCYEEAFLLRNQQSEPNIVGIGGPDVSDETLKHIATIENVCHLSSFGKEDVRSVFDWLLQSIRSVVKHQGDATRLKEHLRKFAAPRSEEPEGSAQMAPDSHGNGPPGENLSSGASKTVEGGEAEHMESLTPVGEHEESSDSTSSPDAGQDKQLSPARPASALWKEVEPIDTSDPCDHKFHDKVETENNWVIIGASRRGKSHAHEGKYREDAFTFCAEAEWHIIAVADGAGSRPLSRVGANTAVYSAVDGMRSSLAASADMDSLEARAQQALKIGLESAYEAIRGVAECRGRSSDDFASTLGLMLHRPQEQGDIIAVAQVGDPLLAGLFNDQRIEVFADDDAGIYAGETSFLTSSGVIEEFDSRIRIHLPPGKLRLIALMTDGVANDFYPHQKHLGSFFDAMRKISQQENNDQELLDWLGYDKRGSFDDRTVVILFPREAH